MVSNHNYLINVSFITDLNSLMVVNDINFISSRYKFMVAIRVMYL